MKHWNLSLATALLAGIGAASVLCALASLALPAYAQGGAQPSGPVVATSTLPFADPARQRSITSELWYPAQEGVQASDFRALPPFVALSLAPGAAPAAGLGKRPLIVISHGNWGSRYSQGWIARSLVVAGYIVLSVSHPGTMNGDLSVAGRARLWERSRDVSSALDQLLALPQWRGLIDERRVGFLGHSFGGFTGVSLAGGVWDAAGQQAACEAQNPKDLYCGGFAETQDPAISRDGMATSFRDARFKAFYIMGSGPAAGFARESLAAIRVPFFVDTAGLDDVLAPAINSTALAQAIPGARELVRPIGHFTYVPECRPIIGRALVALICTDPPGVDRRAAHQAIELDVVTFFKTTL